MKRFSTHLYRSLIFTFGVCIVYALTEYEYFFSSFLLYVIYSAWMVWLISFCVLLAWDMFWWGNK